LLLILSEKSITRRIKNINFDVAGTMTIRFVPILTYSLDYLTLGIDEAELIYNAIKKDKFPVQNDDCLG